MKVRLLCTVHKKSLIKFLCSYKSLEHNESRAYKLKENCNLYAKNK